MGELALGRNVLCAFMPWGGYNYERNLLSERLVMEDVSLLSIEEYEAGLAIRKWGQKKSPDIPNVGDDMLKDLDERIIRIGAEVRAGDILVGKVTPKGETELTAEERLLRAIFGEKAREMRDTSLKVPMVKLAKLSMCACSDGKTERIAAWCEHVGTCLYRSSKISEGDKMAGAAGNKIISYLAGGGYAFLADGTPVDIV